LYSGVRSPNYLGDPSRGHSTAEREREREKDREYTRREIERNKGTK
jgi:hypothetical protein